MLSKNKFKYFVVFLLINLLLFMTPNQRSFGESPNAEMEQIIIPPSSELGDPAYDSGWEELGTSGDPIDLIFDHNLGGDPEDYLIDLSCKADTLGVYNCTNGGFEADAHWYDLTATSISVYAEPFFADSVRVRIYKLVPVFDSGWRENPSNNLLPADIDIKHSLEDDPRDYLLDLECRNGTILGIYDCVDHGFEINAQWHGLTNISVTTRVSSSLPDDVRVRIYQLDQPTQPDPNYYNSGWEELGPRVDPTPFPFVHNLGGDIDNYFVTLECFDDTSLGFYNCNDLDFNTNAQWNALTETDIEIYALGGTIPDRVRVRIWKVPLISNFDATPTSGLAPLEVKFSNLSTGYKSCLWFFGDGDTSTNCNDPQHIYTSGGVYHVLLRVCNTAGCSNHAKTYYIHVDFGTYLPIILR